MTNQLLRRERILQTLSAFAHQRPGLEYANYGDAQSYRAKSRAITRDLRDHGVDGYSN